MSRNILMQRRKKSFRWMWGVGFLVLVVVVVAIVVVVINNNSNKKDEAADGQQTVNVDVSDSKKVEEKSEGELEKDIKQEEKAPQYEGESPNKSETLTGLITFSDTVNEKLVIRTNIDQFLQTGNCKLTLSKDGVVYYSQSVGIQESVTTSTCDGYEILKTELPEGKLQIDILLESEGKSGKIIGEAQI